MNHNNARHFSFPSWWRSSNNEEKREALCCGILKENLVLYLQPQVCLKTGRVVGAEALVRWRFDREIIMPELLIPYFEKNGLVDLLFDAVFQKTIEVISQNKPQSRDFRVSVNVSPVQLTPDFPDQVVNILRKTSVNPRHLALEITEGVIVDDFEVCRSILQSVASMNIFVYIDDFGTGQSSLACLRRLPVQGIKIPKEFVSEITDDRNLVLMNGLCEIVKKLDLHTVAEGVESETQKKILQVVGCKAFQGYLFSRPVPAEDFVEKFLIENS